RKPLKTPTAPIVEARSNGGESWLPIFPGPLPPRFADCFAKHASVSAICPHRTRVASVVDFTPAQARGISIALNRHNAEAQRAANDREASEIQTTIARAISSFTAKYFLLLC